MSEIPLGKQTDYPDYYDAGLLYPVNRAENRKSLGIGHSLPFYGYDHWRAYELSWLDAHGMPVVRMADILVPCESLCLIESKSLKLYFNSLNQYRFDSDTQALETIQRDLSNTAGATVEITLIDCLSGAAVQITDPECSVLLDTLNVDNFVPAPSPELLKIDVSRQSDEVFLSNLFRSRCPITAQPDWGTIRIQYRGPAVDHRSLLSYIVSFRQHSGFHENCVEQIFMDLNKVCSPTKLEVSINFLRRGGIEINPFRSLSQQRGMKALPRYLRQ